MLRRMRQQRRHRKYDIVFLFVALVTIKPSNMGGDCEGVKGATADIRLFPLPPCRIRRRETFCAASNCM